MEYDDDEQFSDLFLTDKVEKSIREKIMVDVPAESYAEFDEKLKTDVFNHAKINGLDSISDFSFVPGEGPELQGNIDDPQEGEAEEEAGDEDEQDDSN